MTALTVNFCARCTVERLIQAGGLQGVRRGKPWKTSIPDELSDRPLDLVERQFHATGLNQLWIVGFTYVATWSVVVYVAFVIDVFNGEIIGWKASKNMQTGLVLDALEQAIRQRGKPAGVVNHNDRGSQYLSIAYTTRLAESKFKPSVGSTGDSYDNAMADDLSLSTPVEN